MFRCPYADTKVWCDKRKSEDDDNIVCDSCEIILTIGCDINDDSL